MKASPILFSAPMVRALLAGTKSQTRRAITRRNSYVNGFRATAAQWAALDFASSKIFVDPGPSPAGNPGPYLHVPHIDGDLSHRVYPQWRPGDTLWVREALRNPVNGQTWTRRYHYAADDSPSTMFSEKDKPGSKPSIHMPRFASRITLNLTEIRVERLQAISEADAQAEGVTPQSGRLPERPRISCDHTTAYALLWDQINGPGAWRSNPWVWVLSFHVTTGTAVNHDSARAG